ncbi:MAG: NAD(+) synthase [Oligosphaeraceae bacterium]
MGFKGVYRVVAAVPRLFLADPRENVREIGRLYREAVEAGAAVVVFPELSLTGYSCGDLFEQRHLLDAALEGLEQLRSLTETEGRGAVLVVGLPVEQGPRLFNAAAVLQNGRLLGVTAKTYLPEYREFYEQRQFCSAREITEETWRFQGREVPFGAGLLYEVDGGRLCFGVEICEDLWVVKPPSQDMALQGAQLILNLSAGPELVAKAEYRRMLVSSQSARLMAMYVLAGAGVGESSSDLVFSGHALAACNGTVLAESQRFQQESQWIQADFVPRWMDAQRRSWSSFHDCPAPRARRIPGEAVPGTEELQGLRLPLHPFVPENSPERNARCDEIFRIQATGLARRVTHTHARRLVIGLSGGLDSTLALLVCARCCQLLQLPPSFILAVTMPGMGTSGRTKNNAVGIARETGAELREIPIAPAVARHFQDIGHDPEKTDVVYENAQARERTQILMDLANQEGGILVGTGDLSEIALGWSTFNGDHMSMYCVNCGVPKTLIRFMVEYAAEHAAPALAKHLLDVNDTPVSPELLPGQQHTEEIIGNYDLHDFFLYFFLKYGETPENILLLAQWTFREIHPPEKIRKTLALFFRRFFSQQFKRNAMPDGPKVGTIALSPRGDWRMPADAFASLFSLPEE